MSAPLPSALLELISELLPVEPSSNSPLHLLHRIRGPICLLRRWNAHIGAEARRAVTSGSEEWINLAQSDKKKLKRIANPQKEKEFDEKGVALFLILGLWVRFFRSICRRPKTGFVDSNVLAIHSIFNTTSSPILALIRTLCASSTIGSLHRLSHHSFSSRIRRCSILRPFN